MLFEHLCLEHFRFISKGFALFCGGHLSVAMLLLPIILVEVPLPRPLLRAVAKGYRRHAPTPCVTGCPRSARKTTHRHGLASGVSPTARYQSRTPLAVTAIVIICLASPSARCSQDQHSCNTTAVATTFKTDLPPATTVVLQL